MVTEHSVGEFILWHLYVLYVHVFVGSFVKVMGKCFCWYCTAEKQVQRERCWKYCGIGELCELCTDKNHMEVYQIFLLEYLSYNLKQMVADAEKRNIIVYNQFMYLTYPYMVMQYMRMCDMCRVLHVQKQISSAVSSNSLCLITSQSHADYSHIYVGAMRPPPEFQLVINM